MEICFYKYRELAASDNFTKLHPFTQNLIQKGEIYFSAPADFNDPFDGMVYYSDAIDITAIENLMERLLIPEEQKRQVLRWCQKHPKQLSQTYTDMISNAQQTKSLKIYCLSKDPLNVLMWAHYAKDHTGVCIGLKAYQLDERAWGIKVQEKCVSDKLSEPTVPNMLIPIPVIYTSQVPGKYDFGKGNSEVLKEVFLHKAPDWQYEQEYRIVATEKTLLRNPVIIDVNEIEEIVFGLKASPLLINQVKDIVSKSPYKQPGPKLYQCQRIIGTYCLKKVLLKS